MKFLRPLALLVLAAACTAKERARADSAAAVASQQKQLATQLAAQKDSLTQVVLDADKFITQIDSQISRVKGLPKHQRAADSLESPLQQQLQARKEMLARVDALVQRARRTAALLAKEQGKNKELQAQLEKDQQMIADLQATIARQTETIATLTTRVDSLAGVTQQLGQDLDFARATNAKAFYVIGREDELLKKGVIVREGGANLLFAHPGRTLQPARKFDLAAFTPIDQREVHEIHVPDSTRRYQIVSRQSLDNAEVAMRDRSTFKGDLKITDADRFWAPSRYLIIVEK